MKIYGVQSILKSMETVHNSQTRTTVKLKDKTVTIIGTAHISGDSVKEIDEVIDEINPDRICIELDESRFKTVSENRRWEDMNIIKVLKEKKGFLLLANLVLSSFQKRMGSDVGVNPGADMKKRRRRQPRRGYERSRCFITNTKHSVFAYR